MTLKFLRDKILHSGMTYEEYKKLFADQIENPPGVDGKNNYDIKKLNFARSTRVEKQFVPSDELIEAVKKNSEPQLWMILTESWCCDSAQILPVIAKIADLNPNIKLKILLRDSYPEVMDQYLTNGTRSIPKLIAFSKDYKELFRWGPRPKTAKRLVFRLKEDGMSKSGWQKELHLWYGRNRGKELKSELVQLLMKSKPAINTVIGIT